MIGFRIDPRTRLALAVSLTTLAVIINRAVWQASLLIVTVVLCLALGKGGIKLLTRAKWIFGFFVMMAILQSVFNSDERVVFAIKNVTLLTLGGLELGVCFLCRMLVIIFSAGILAAAGSRSMIQGLIALRLPYELAFMTTCAISFLPMIASDMKDSVTALQLRGVDLGGTPFTRRLKVYGYLIVPVLEGIVIKARELSCAMEMRAFRAYNKRTSYTVISLKAADYAIMTLILVFSVASVIAYFNIY